MDFEPRNVLQDFGLSDKEIDVYLAALKTGNATATEIAQAADVFRTYCYDILESLEERGLISKITRAGVQHFKAVHPRRLEEILKEQQYKIKQIMPELTSHMQHEEKPQEVRFLEGQEGIKYVHEDVLNEKPNEVLVIGHTAKAYEAMQWYLPKYINARVENNIGARVLTEPSDTAKNKIKANDDEHLRETRFLPDTIPTLKYIYADKVSIFTFDTNTSSTLIENQVTAEGERQTFNTLWELSKAVQ